MAAAELAAASTVEEARRSEPQVVLACARCHAHTHAILRFADEPPPPSRSMAARHRWAIDRAWQGMLGAGQDAWRQGLTVIASGEIAVDLEPHAAAQADRLRRRARAALDERGAGVTRRIAIYGEMLATCAGCHARRRPGPR